MGCFYATRSLKPVYIAGFRIVHSSAAHSDSEALYRFLSADEIKKTAASVWCAFQQHDLPASSRYGLRGEFLWGGLNSCLSSFPPPLALHTCRTQTACRAVQCLYFMYATVLLTGNNKPGSKVKRDCRAQVLACSSGKCCAYRHRKQCPRCCCRTQRA